MSHQKCFKYLCHVTLRSRWDSEMFGMKSESLPPHLVQFLSPLPHPTQRLQAAAYVWQFGNSPSQLHRPPLVPWQRAVPDPPEARETSEQLGPPRYVTYHASSVEVYDVTLGTRHLATKNS